MEWRDLARRVLQAHGLGEYATLGAMQQLQSLLVARVPLLLSPASADTSSLLLPASWPDTVYKGGPIGAPAEGVAAFLGAVCCSSVGKYDLMFCWLGSSPALKYIGGILIKVNIKGVRVNNLVKAT